MKKILFLIICLSTVLTSFAQDDRYTSAMNKNIALMDSAKTVQDLQSTANTFERIANAEQTKWLPYYYAGFCEVRIAYMMAKQDIDKIDEWADKAEADADKADSLSSNNAEILCLQSMIASSRIMVDPQSRGQEYGMKSAELLSKAQQIDPDNPRVYFLQGESAFYTPAQYGGGKDKAKPLFEKALEKFDTFKPKTDLDPEWGKELAQSLLAQCN